MNIQLIKLETTLSKEIVEFEFSTNYTYIYGEISTGKSTIAELVDYCLGGKIELTPALQNEFTSAKLFCFFDKLVVTLTREKESNMIKVSWKDNDIEYNVNAPLLSKNKIILPHTDIENFSDLMFHLLGLKAPKVRSSEINEEYDLKRLSFRDILWFCYLNQDDIDSSFFNLGPKENKVLQSKARSALRYILGYHDDRVSELEAKLFSIRNRSDSLYKEINQIKEFLNENQFDYDTVATNISNFGEQIIKLENDKKILKVTPKTSDHLIDELRRKSLNMDLLIGKIENEIYYCNMTIEEQTKLLHEYTMDIIKLKRVNQAGILINEVDFKTCPQCGLDIKNNLEKDKCQLCKQSLGKTIVIDFESLTTDLKDRIEELEESIARLNKKMTNSSKELKKLISEKNESDKRYEELQQYYDTNYLSRVSNIERNIGILQGKLDISRDLLSSLQKIKNLDKEYLELKDTENKISMELSDLKNKIGENNPTIKKLRELFLDTLIRIGLPGVNSNDIIELENSSFYPAIIQTDENSTELNFFNAGSGGKKALFKSCFVISLHRLSELLDLRLPRFLIIDTPTKSVGDILNEKEVNKFFNGLYSIMEEIKSTQVIVIDNKEYIEPKLIKFRIVRKKFTSKSPFITYYLDKQ